ncbi:MAG: hypothetical protein ACT4PI_12440 [Actinomycetota bacterium]
MAKFAQMIEYTTTKYDEMNKLTDEWLAETKGKRTSARAVSGQDRDRPNTYIDFIEFPSYEEAMKNNDLPETQAMAEKMQALCDGPATFRNLGVVRIDDELGGPAGFAQIIEYKTTKRDEMDKLTDDFLAATAGRRTVARAVSGRDRDRPDTYVDLIEFPSYEEAMKTNELPETDELAQKSAALSDGPVAFRNLDVMRIDED